MRDRWPNRRFRPSVLELTLTAFVAFGLCAFLARPETRPRIGLTLAVVGASLALALGLPRLVLRLLARLAAFYPLLVLLALHLVWWIPHRLLGADAEGLPPTLAPRNLPVYGELIRTLERALPYDPYVWMGALGVALALCLRILTEAEPRERRRLRWSLLGLVLAWGLALGYEHLDPLHLMRGRNAP